MKKKQWSKVITAKCEALGTMRPSFETAINVLAEIMEARDEALKQFRESGGELCVDKVSDRGSVNKTKNPFYVVWAELNNQVLQYLNALGLTQKGLKYINAHKVDVPDSDSNPLMRMIEEIESQSQEDDKSKREGGQE